jgi:hypothetical protein
MLLIISAKLCRICQNPLPPETLLPTCEKCREEAPRDYYYFLLNKGFGWEEDSLSLRKSFDMSLRKGQFEDIYYRKRHTTVGPGRFWGRSKGTTYLNQFLRGPGKRPWD